LEDDVSPLNKEENMGKRNCIGLATSMKLQIIGLTAVLVLLVVQAGYAYPISFNFTGTVTQTIFDPADPYGGTIGFGTPIVGYYTFESTVADAVPLDNKTGSYTSNGNPFGMAVNIGGNIFNSFGYLNIGVANNYPTGDQYTVTTQSSSGDLYLKLFLQDSTGTAFNSDALPKMPPNLSQFLVKDFQLIASFLDPLSGYNQVEIDGNVNSIAPVPEPGTLLLIASGLPLLALARRFRNIQ
jgi:hypothetical protein